MIISVPAGSRRARVTLATAALFILTVYFGLGIRDTFVKSVIEGSADGRQLPYSAPMTAPEPLQHTPDSSPPAPASQEEPLECLRFEELQNRRPGPLSEGKRQFPLVRPPPGCRTFNLAPLEALLGRMKNIIKDPDLYRLFENSYPNTLDTMIKWRGHARQPVSDETAGGEQQLTRGAALGPETDEELTYVITGDIDAMWLRDSASQVYSYLPLLEADASHDSLAGLWRGLINLQARYIIISPYCHSFQPPTETDIPPTYNGAYSRNNPQPPYNPELVFDCKWELDSLASFLQISAAYHKRTGDLAFFGRFRWAEAVRAAVDAAAAMRLGTYDKEGRVEKSAWTFTGWTDRGTETLTNDGLGNPSRANGMVRTAFRPSDDATIFQFLVPANMMFAKYLEEASLISEALAAGGKDKTLAKLTSDMRALAQGIRDGIDRDGVVVHRDFGEIFAYEVDGFGGANLMDDANVPSLLAMPLWNFTSTLTGESGAAKTAGVPKRDHVQIYRNTRRFVLSQSNPYFARGPVLSAVGGPHIGPGRGWPMAAMVAGMTAYDPIMGSGAERAKQAQSEVAEQLRMVLDSTDGKGVIHETVSAWDQSQWSRAWFGWANGLFGELLLRIEEQERMLPGEGLLSRSWQ